MQITSIQAWGGGSYGFDLTSTNVRGPDGLVVGFTPGVHNEVLDEISSPVEIVERLENHDELLLMLHSFSLWATADVLQLRDRLYVTFSDGHQEVFRIYDRGREASGTTDAVYKARSIIDDLASTIFQYRRAPSSRISYRLPRRGITLQDALTIIFDPDHGVASAFQLGTIESGLESLPIDFNANFSNHLQLLNSSCEQAGCEYELRYDDAANIFYVDIVRERGWSAAERTAGVADPDSRPIESPQGHGNRFSLTIEHNEGEYFSRVIPFAKDTENLAGCDGFRVKILSATYNSALGSTTLVLEDDPIYLDHVYVGREVHIRISADGLRLSTTILTATAPHEIVVDGDWSAYTTDLIIADAAAGYVGYVYDPTAESRRGRADLPKEFPVCPYENLFAEQDGSPDLSSGTTDGSGNFIPDGFELVGGATSAQEADALYITFGNSALHLTAPAVGDGIQTKLLNLGLTREEPYVSALIHGRVLAGRWRMYFLGKDDVKRPADTSPEQAELVADDTLAMAIEGEAPPLQTSIFDLVNGFARVVLVAMEAGSEIVFDAITVTRSRGAWDYSPEMGKLALYKAAAEFLTQHGGLQEPSYRMDLFDPKRLMPAGAYNEMKAGAHVRLREEGPNDTWVVDVTGRITELRRIYDPSLGDQADIKKLITLERRPRDLSDRLSAEVEPPASDRAKPARVEPEPEEGTDITSGAFYHLSDVATVAAGDTGVTVADDRIPRGFNLTACMLVVSPYATADTDGWGSHTKFRLTNIVTGALIRPTFDIQVDVALDAAQKFIWHIFSPCEWPGNTAPVWHLSDVIIGASSGEPEPDYEVYDTFTDVDGTNLEDHAPDVDTVGLGWIYRGSVQTTIQGNKGYADNTSSHDIDSGLSDCTVEATFTIGADGGSGDGRCGLRVRINGSSHLAFRYIDGQLSLYSTAAGANLAASAFTMDVDTPYVFKVVLSGTNIVCYVNDVEYFNETSSQSTTSTLHGIYLDGRNSSYATVDDFKVYP